MVDASTGELHFKHSYLYLKACPHHHPLKNVGEFLLCKRRIYLNIPEFFHRFGYIPSVPLAIDCF